MRLVVGETEKGSNVSLWFLSAIGNSWRSPQFICWVPVLEEETKHLIFSF